MTTFHKSWLKLWSILAVILGLVYAAMGLPILGVPAGLYNEAVFMRLFSGGAPAALTPDLVFATGILGSVLVGWGLFFFFTFEELATSATLRRAIAVAFTAWFVLDQFVSWRTGAYGNLLINIPFYLAFMWPVWATRHRY